MFGWFLVFLFLNSDVLGVNVLTKTKFKNAVVLKHFWKSTGLCPASDPKSRVNFLLSNDEKINFDLIGALPNKGIKTIRIHWLLDLVTVSKSESEEPIFHLENLDRLIDRLYHNDLYPSFELMGNPSNYFKDFTIQSKYWVDLIHQIIEHYTDLYGAHYVHKWRFELTNEPDLKQYNPYNFTLNDYIAYFRASEQAVPNLSGPAGLFRNNRKSHPLCWGLLNYCNLNYCNLNTITFHRKGGEIGSQVVQEGVDLIEDFLSEFPNLKGVSFGNDEGDIMKGWSVPMEWRADVRYAALVLQVIIGHIDDIIIKRNIPFVILSNDNAFLSFQPNFFTQRTLLARFQMNNTTPEHVQFFKKPIYSVMGMISLLGDKLEDIQYQPGKKGFSYLVTSYKRHQDTFLGVITDDRVTNETYNGSYVDVNVKITLGNSKLSGIGVGYLMDNDISNPYQVWKDDGSPLFPPVGLRRRMRKAEGFRRIFMREVKPYQKVLKFFRRDVLIPSIFVVNVCYEGTEQPGQVTDLRYVNITHGEVLLLWKDTFVKSRCILTYIVEYKKEGTSIFQRINPNTIFLSYHHDGFDRNGMNIGVTGEYRVAAVDYWNRYGPYSDVLKL